MKTTDSQKKNKNSNDNFNNSFNENSNKDNSSSTNTPSLNLNGSIGSNENANGINPSANNENTNNVSPSAKDEQNKNSSKDNSADFGKESNGVKDTSNAAKDVASEGASAISDSGIPGSKASSAVNSIKSAQQSLAEAAEQDVSESAKDVAIDTLKTLPKAAAHAATQNYAGLAADAVQYLSKNGAKILKIVFSFLLIFILLVSSIAGAMMSLPSMYVENFIESYEDKQSEKQLNKAKEAMYNAYETVVSKTVSTLINESKEQLNVSNFSNWKRMMLNNDNLYSIDTKVVENDSINTIVKRDNTQSISINFKNAYIENFSSIKVNEVAFFNAFSYYNLFKDNEDFLKGNAPNVIGEEEYFETVNKSDEKPDEEKNLWKKKDTKAFKKWIEDNTSSLIKCEMSQNADISSGTGSIKSFTINVTTVATEDEILKLLNFSEKQIEKIKEINFLGDLYVSVSDENSVSGEEKSTDNAIYPFLDIYTNLFPNDSSVPLPENYHKINAKDDGITNENLIERISQRMIKELSYKGFENEEQYRLNKETETSGDWTKYGDWIGTNGTQWGSSFISWIMNEVDESLNQEYKLLENVFLKTNSPSAQAGFLLNNGVWHGESNYVPAKGDIVLLNYLEYSQDIIGSVFPTTNQDFSDFVVNSIGFIVGANSGQIEAIIADNTHNSVEKTPIQRNNSEIVGYVTPNYSFVTGLFNYGADSEYIYPLTCDYKISADFPFYPSGKKHSGVDFAPTSGEIGADIHAINSGVVKKVKFLNVSFGHHLIIDHGNGIESLYGHCSTILVNEGDVIEKGQIIARVGSTGNSTGPHVHLEFRLNGKTVNPWNYLTR